MIGYPFDPRVRLYACIEGAKHGLTCREVLGFSRRRANVRARWDVILRLAREGNSMAAIGHLMNLDHTSVMYALRECGHK